VGAEAGRLRVQLAALEGGAIEGWIDLDDVGISGPPPQWVRTSRQTNLYTTSDGLDSSVSAAAEVDLMVLGDTR
jgi:hypothetical protein